MSIVGMLQLEAEKVQLSFPFSYNSGLLEAGPGLETETEIRELLLPMLLVDLPATTYTQRLYWKQGV